MERSYWNETAELTNFPTLDSHRKVDITVIGGGIVGLTTARLLTDQGLKVALVEARRVGRQATGKSTAKVTSQHGLLYHTLKQKFSLNHAQLYADAQQAGLAQIRQLTARFALDCDLETADAYTYTCKEEHVATMEQELEIARQLGLPATLLRHIDLPFGIKAALHYTDQAQFHPTRYLSALAATLAADGCEIYENSVVIDWDATTVHTATGSIKAKHVVMATHLPLGVTGGYYTRAFPDAEPVVAAPVTRAPQGMFVNVETPSHSLRTHRHRDGSVYAIVAGTRFKPGDTEAERRNFADIEHWLRQHFGADAITHRWVNEDYSSMDSAPFVGWSSTLGEDFLIATGFAGWGLTNGTAAAMMIRDLVIGRDNPWLELFNAKRIKPLAGAGKLLKESAGVAANLLKGHLGRHADGLEDLAAGEADVRKIDGKKVAVFRDEQQQLHMVSAVCTHMGCLVGWNNTDRTWDCACHGSRFALDGSVIHGPAVKPLRRV